MAFVSPQLATLEQSLRESLQKEAADSQKRQRAVELQRETWEQNRQVLTVPEELSTSGKEGGDKKQQTEEDASILTTHAREAAIEKRKLQVKEKVQFQLNRVSNEARRLDELRRELDSLEDPTRREVSDIRKKIETVDRELKPLKQLCERKEKELKEAVLAHNDKTKLKTELVSRLMEVS
ncbi:hypothetical protein AXG93_131s1000 [Marchantia polymorpha subsp. ruderalis]|uniref:RAB6-interacting golgin n=1 Tax=Marchantia polymorpha subsp. ruderalis TaxID=1480154 RepID=A0A176VZZ6_MARPO|nr:hypothetical protein AXG93_131s1000 [Marchantia polymorpha subsp. ruderalis]